MKKVWIIVSCVLVATLLAGIGYVGWQHYQEATYIYIGGVRYLRAETRIDLSDQPDPDIVGLTQMEQLTYLDLRGTGIEAAQYDLLRTALPACRILWDIPFQDRFYEEGTTLLTITKLSEEDLAALTYFPKLTDIDARGCSDYDAIMRLVESFPQYRVAYQVTVGDIAFLQSTTELTAMDADPGELETALAYLPELQSIRLTGKLPDAEWLIRTAQAYSDVQLRWEYLLFDRIYDSTVTEIDLSDIPMENTEAVEAALPYLPSLQKVIMSNCGIPSVEMDALNKRHEDVRFVWTVRVGRGSLRTDATTFMPYLFGYDQGSSIRDHQLTELKYCTDLILIDMGHMSISDISFLEYMPNMQYLLLCETKITDLTPVSHCKELKYLEIFNTPIQDLSPLAGCTKLEDVNLCYLYFSNLEVLSDLPELKHIWLIGSYYSQTELQAVMASHPDAVFCLREIGSSTGYGWRKTENYYAQRDLLGLGYMTF